jgi:hypothetical protein
MQHVEATSGASRAARGKTGTLASNGECLGRRRHPNRGRSILHTVCGGGQTAQDVVRVSDMDGERPFGARRPPTNVFSCKKIFNHYIRKANYASQYGKLLTIRKSSENHESIKFLHIISKCVFFFWGNL